MKLHDYVGCVDNLVKLQTKDDGLLPSRPTKKKKKGSGNGVFACSCYKFSEIVAMKTRRDVQEKVSILQCHESKHFLSKNQIQSQETILSSKVDVFEGFSNCSRLFISRIV